MHIYDTKKERANNTLITEWLEHFNKKKVREARKVRRKEAKGAVQQLKH